MHCSYSVVTAFRVHHVLREHDYSSRRQGVCWCSGVRRSCWSHLHVVQHLEEGEGHAAADDHLVHLVQHVVDQLDLIFHLRSETHRHASLVEIRVTQGCRGEGEDGKGRKILQKVTEASHSQLKPTQEKHHFHNKSKFT